MRTSQIDTSLQGHLAGMDAKNSYSCFWTWRGELDLSVYPTWSKQSRIENVDSVGRHDDLEFTYQLEAWY